MHAIESTSLAWVIAIECIIWNNNEISSKDNIVVEPLFRLLFGKRSNCSCRLHGVDIFWMNTFLAIFRRLCRLRVKISNDFLANNLRCICFVSKYSCTGGWTGEFKVNCLEITFNCGRKRIITVAVANYFWVGIFFLLFILGMSIKLHWHRKWLECIMWHCQHRSHRDNWAWIRHVWHWFLDGKNRQI